MADTVQAIRRWEPPIRAHLLALAAAILLPIVLAAGGLLWRYADAERDRYRESALELARQLAEDVDRELGGMVLALRVLATSPALQAGDLAAFDAQARAVLRYRGANVVMRDPTGQQLVNTRVPWGTSLPVAADPRVREADAAVFATGQPYVSDLLVGTVSGQQLLFADVPVSRDGTVAYALNMTITPARLSEMLAAGLPSPEWMAVVLDRNDRIAGRSREAERAVGTPVAEDLRRYTTGTEGVWSDTEADGTPVLAAYARPKLAGWRVVVTVPEVLVEAPLRRLLLLLLAGAALVLGLSALLAAWWGDRLARPVRALVEAGAALGRGEPVAALASRVREVALVGRALAAASARLREGEARLRARNAELEELTRALDLAQVAIRDPDGRVRRWSGGLERLYGWTAAEAVGRAAGELLAAEVPEPVAALRAAPRRGGGGGGGARPP